MARKSSSNDGGCLGFLVLLWIGYVIIKEYPMTLFYIALGIAAIWLTSSVYGKVKTSAEEREKELKSRAWEVCRLALNEVDQLMGSDRLNELESIIKKVVQDEATMDTYYTNSEFAEKMERFIPKFEGAYEIYDKILWKTPFRVGRVEDRDWAETPYGVYKRHKKGFDGEERVRKQLVDSGIDFMESVNLRNGDFQIEVDFMVVVGNTVVTLEVKDYSAEEIILDDSGQLYKVVKGKEIPVENVLPQINRHKRFIRENFPKGTEVITLIVLSDKQTLVKNHIREDDIRIVVPSYVANIVDKLSGKDEVIEKEIRERIKELRAKERRFKFFNIEELEKELDRAFYNGDSVFQKFVGQYTREDAKEIVVDTFNNKFFADMGYRFTDCILSEHDVKGVYRELDRKVGSMWELFKEGTMNEQSI